jgi:hypothetical protein
VPDENSKFLQKKDFSVYYVNINYKDSLQEWLKDCSEKVGNIGNLSIAIKSYIQVVQKLTGKYRSNVMSLIEYINNLPSPQKKNFLNALISINSRP